MTTRTRLLGALLAVLAHSHPAGSAPLPAEQTEGPLTVCLADANPPFSASSLPDGGLDAELARAIGRQLGREIRLVWVTIPNRGGLGKALGQQLGGGACSLFAGIPESGGPNEDLTEKNLMASDGYLETGYVLIAAHGSLRSLDEARRLNRIGVVTATPADLYLFQQQLRRVPHGSNEALLAALAEGSVDAAVLWQPALARARLQGKAPTANGIQLPGASRTRFVLALPRKDPALLARVNAALAHLRTDGSLASILQTHGLAP
ncbi:substrate-binding periplasmic protein [Zoogloea dura]|uniref:Transporter substrate-binding domain-containing protein n=1 Tax=Zoogloea dura TaxID=2728840 RepID=A0A848FZB5_9RHOO|nr:transporter substrate-binding domain-containing protein [Zoogloea dura]NML25277.1 transporter substrate-binding domain-containing protein [Zoogloea dura]